MSHPPGRDGMLTFDDQDFAVAPSTPPDDLSVPEAPDDLALLHEDLMAETRGDMAGAGGCGVKVNELLLSTTKSGNSQPNDEYVEIYNTCATSKSLKGWSLRYRSGGNNGDPTNASTILVQDINKTIPATGYLLYAGKSYTKTHDGLILNGLSDSSGGVALIDDNGDIADSVCYGNVDANHNFREGSPAPLPPQVAQPGKVVARSPNGTDSDDNSADFKVQAPTPKAPNS